MSHKVRNINRYRKLALIFLFISIPSGFFSSPLNSKILGIVSIVLLMAFLIISFVFWRCPCCKKRLPIRFDSENDIDDLYVCPYCNTKFYDGNIID